MQNSIEAAKTAARVILAAALFAGAALVYAGKVRADLGPTADPAVQALTPDVPPAEVKPVPQAADDGAADAAAEAPPPSAVLTLEQVREAMAEAQKRREVLLQPDLAVADQEVRKALLERWGVEVYGVRLSARGYMIDFRFRVVDLEKALPLFDPRVQPYLLTEGTNIKLPVPVGEKVGAFRTTNRGKNITANRDYYMMFANPDSYVKPGQKVSVVIGEFRAEHMSLR